MPTRSQRPWSWHAGWSTTAPTCSTSAANRPGPATPPWTQQRRSAGWSRSSPRSPPPCRGTPFSIDTTKVVVAEAALAAGADLLNDVWGTGSDPGLAELAASAGVPLLVMHNRAEARYDDVVREVVADLRAALERAERAGVPASDLIVDPGIGFGKTADHNVAVLRHLGALRSLGRPILLGTSRKSTLGKILDLPPEERLEATLATTALGIAAGIDIVRVHDVRANVRVARVSDAIVRGRWRSEPEGGPA